MNDSTPKPDHQPPPSDPTQSEGARRRLGDILVDEGVLQPEELEKLLQLQDRQASVERQPLGKLAVELGFLSERRLRDILDLHGKRMPLGELLVARGLVEPTDLNAALEEQEEDGGLLGEILIRKGHLDEVDLTQVLADQIDIPYVPLETDESWKESLASLVNVSYAIKHGIAPVSYIGRTLTLGIWHPMSLGLQHEVEQSTGLTVRFILDRRGMIYERIRTLYDLDESQFRVAVDGEPSKQAAPATRPAPVRSERYQDLDLADEEAAELERLQDEGIGVFIVCGVTPDEVEEFYLRFLRYAKAGDRSTEHRQVIGLGQVNDSKSAESAFRDLDGDEIRLALVPAANTTAAIGRLLGFGVHQERLSNEVAAALALCSIRTNCSECSEQYQPHKLVLAEWFGGIEPPKGARWKRGTGCDACDGTGYRGVRVVCEFWMPTSDEREWIRHDAGRGSTRQLREEFLHRVTGLGLKSLQLAVRGETTLEEVLKVLPPQEVRSVRQAA